MHPRAHTLTHTQTEIDWLIDWTLFLNGEDISTKADSHICRCYSTTNNQDIHSQIQWQKAIDKYSINNNNTNNNTYKTRQRLQRKWKKEEKISEKQQERKSQKLN